MLCEMCGNSLAAYLDAAVRVEQAAKSARFLGQYVDEYHDLYGLTVVRGQVGRLMEVLGGCVVVCRDCRMRLGVLKPTDASVPTSTPEGSRAPADLERHTESPPTIEECLAGLSAQNQAVQQHAVDLLVEMGQEVLPSLLEWLRTNPGDCSYGLRALALIQGAEAAPVLLQFLLHGSMPEQLEATRAAIGLGRDCLPSFDAALHPEAGITPDQCRCLLQVLGKMGEEGAPILCAHLTHPQPDIRRAAIRALEMNPVKGCAGAVAQLLKDDCRDLRKSAAVLLGRIGDPAGASLLTEALGDPSAEIRTAAAWALVRLGQPIPVDAVLQAAGKVGEKWLYAALLQVCGKSKKETIALLNEVGYNVTLVEDLGGEWVDSCRKGKELLTAGSFEAAEAALRKASDAAVVEMEPLIALTQCQVQNRKWSEAVATLQRVVGLDSFNARWHYNLGVVHFQYGDVASATEQWRQPFVPIIDETASSLELV